MKTKEAHMSKTIVAAHGDNPVLSTSNCLEAEV